MKKPSENNKEEDQPYEQFETDDKNKKPKQTSFLSGKNILIGLIIIGIAIAIGIYLNKQFSFLPGASKKKRVVIALGGNALGKNLEEQRRDVKVSAKAIADLLEENCEVLVVHGNGPQVGLINNAFNEYYNNHKKDGGFPVPLSMAGAMSEAYIGYDLQNALQEEFANRKLKVNGVATLITQTEVDENDPAFKNPTKPIGQFMTKEQAEEKAKELGWEIVEDSGRGYRRVVASPIPNHIVEIEAINAMFNAGSIVICAGGGGIPVFKRGNGHEGAPAVIDKDNAASLLARQINADLLIILTAVEKVAINFNKPNQKELDKMTVAEAKKYSDEGQFAPGSMLPKIRAASLFAKSGKGKKAIIGHLYKAKETIQGLTGTIIYDE
jgi:carbamate kinase